ncbi:MAG TPA: hypothetical protein VGJ47_02695 [Gemmatimonadaceae bacterium]
MAQRAIRARKVLIFNAGSATVYVREVSTSPHVRSASIWQHPGATGDAFPSAKGRFMVTYSISIAGLRDRTERPFELEGLNLYERVKTPADDKAFFAFMGALRNSVRARVAAAQQRGRPLREIVVEVREMTLLAEREAPHPKPFSAHVFRAIVKQAIAWSVEAYRARLIAESSVDESSRLLMIQGE